MATAAPQASIDLGRVISRGLDALGKNFLPFLVVALVLSGIPGFLLYYALAGLIADPNVPASVMSGLLSVLGSILVTIVTTALLQGILSRSTILHLSGRPADVGNSVSVAIGLLLSIVGMSILVGLATVFGLMLLIVPGVIIYIMFIVCVPVLMEERKGVSASLSRSVELTKGSRPMIFLMLVLFLIATYIISMILGVLFVAVAGAAGGLSPVIAAVSGAIDSTISGLLGAVMVASLYVELRTIREGASTEDLGAVFA